MTKYNKINTPQITNKISVFVVFLRTFYKYIFKL